MIYPLTVIPQAFLAKGTDEVYVGEYVRIWHQKMAFFFYTVADNIRKGAAANAVQIAKALLTEMTEGQE